MKKIFILTCMAMLMAAHSLTAIAAKQELRVMSFNIPYKNVVSSTNTWEMIASHLHDYFETTSPDVLGMQEPVREELISLLVGMPGYAMVGFARDNGAESGEYTPIMYKTERFFLLDQGSYWLTDTPDVPSKTPGAAHRRIATWALLEDKATGARFLYTNTHLSYESPEVKYPQIKVLKEQMRIVQDKYGDEVPHFLTGDFNMCITEQENYNYVKNYKILMKDSWFATRKKSNKNGGSDESRIDYVYATNNVTCSYAEWGNQYCEDDVRMSDHHPIFADFYWTTNDKEDVRAAITEAWAAIDSTMTYVKRRTKLVTTASMLDSDGVETSKPLAYAVDGNTNTYCHSLENMPPNQHHYFQVNLNRTISNFYFSYARRYDDTHGVPDRWLDVKITASNDKENWDYITEIYDFGGDMARAYDSGNIALHKPYKYIRFTIMRTPGMRIRNSSPQYSLSEFQMYEQGVASTCEYSSVETITAAVDNLKAIIETTESAIADGTATSDNVTAVQEGIQALRNARHEYATAIKTPTTSDAKKSYYSLSGQAMPSQQKGVNIVVSENGETQKVLMQ